MNTGELITVLKNAGLSPYQAEAYVTLLELGSASARDLADASGVPGPRIYDVLRDLEDLGYVTTYEQDQLYTRANDPTEALSELRMHVGQFTAAINEIEQRWCEPEEHDYEARLVRRFQTVFSQAEQAIANASHHVRVSVTPGYFTELRPALRKAHERGILVHILLYSPSDGELQKDEIDFTGVCTEARRRDPCWDESFAALVDSQKVCFAWYHNTPQEYGVLVNDPGQQFVYWFYFMSLWDISETLYSETISQFPLTFTEIRDCIRTIEPHLQDGATVRAQSVGHRVSTRRPCELNGVITETRYTGGTTESEVSPLRLAGQAALVLQTKTEIVTIGGINSVVEDVEADSITVEEISHQKP